MMSEVLNHHRLDGGAHLFAPHWEAPHAGLTCLVVVLS